MHMYLHASASNLILFQEIKHFPAIPPQNEMYHCFPSTFSPHMHITVLRAREWGGIVREGGKGGREMNRKVT